ncbi:hypothetical protein AB6809_29560 [Paraburkholderia sp. RCC_158]|uniref:hypothetical protein n=1 Tax=Paraburkholderia sp. RCC_158 TaxID=3239220 RepID=UPI003523BA7A
MSESSYDSIAEAIAKNLDGIVKPLYEGSKAAFRFRVSLPQRNAALLLRFSPHRGNERLAVSCLFPERKGVTVVPTDYLDADELRALRYVPEITVSLKKTPALIAADIRRRIVPGYLTVLERIAAGSSRQ